MLEHETSFIVITGKKNTRQSYAYNEIFGIKVTHVASMYTHGAVQSHDTT